MIKPKKNIFYVWLLNKFLDYKFKNSFSSVSYFWQTPIDTTKSILIIGNHTTWWDGFVAWQLNRRFFDKKYYVIMLEENLKKLPFFQKIGAFSIHPKSKSIVETLQISVELLQKNDTFLVFFPQGKLQSIYNDTFVFAKGVDKILNKSKQTQLIAYALFWDFAANEKPYLSVYITNLDVNQDFQTQYNEFYKNSKRQHISTFKH